MNLINNKASVASLMEEVTEGVLLGPSGATKYVALQPDFSIVPAQEEITNDELKNSLGVSKSTLGIESPTASGTFYLRGSGVEGTAPNFAPFFKSTFGSQTVIGTERDTVSSSTAISLNVDTGEGAEFARGHPLLVKDGVNGHQVRFVDAVSTDALALSFALSGAPASGVNLGKAVYWSPANSGHPSLSMIHYLGNQGARIGFAGGRVTAYSIAVNAGANLTTNISMLGTWFGFNQIEITASNRYLDFNDGGSSVAAVLALGIYKDPHELAEALQNAMNALTSDEITVVYNDSGANAGKYTIASDGSTLELEWNTGTNAANSVGTTLGFLVAADDTGALTYTSDSALSYSAPHTPTYDANTDPIVVKDNQIFIGDQSDNVCFKADTITWNMGTPTTQIKSICSESGVAATLVTGREVTVDVSAALEQYDADVFRRYRLGSDTRFQMALGPKNGGSWIPGKVICGYLPTATITAASVVDVDSTVFINFTLKAFVNSNGQGEVYLGQL